jgi:hypothetical protein
MFDESDTVQIESETSSIHTLRSSQQSSSSSFFTTRSNFAKVRYNKIYNIEEKETIKIFLFI